MPPCKDFSSRRAFGQSGANEYYKVKSSKKTLRDFLGRTEYWLPLNGKKDEEVWAEGKAFIMFLDCVQRELLGKVSYYRKH